MQHAVHRIIDPFSPLVIGQVQNIVVTVQQRGCEHSTHACCERQRARCARQSVNLLVSACAPLPLRLSCVLFCAHIAMA